MSGKTMWNGSKLKIMWAGNKIKKGMWAGNVIYSSGNIVTYIVDSGIAYQEEVDSDASCLSPKTFTPSKSGWTFIGWRQDTSASGSVLTNKIMGDAPVTLYAVFRQTVTITYYNGTTTASSTSGYKYYNNGNIVNPTFTISQTAINGWSARGWSTGTAGNAAVTYSSISNTAIASSVTLYGMYQQTITVTYYNNSTTASTTTGNRYYNSVGNIVNPSFTLTQASSLGWTARGWSTSNAGNAAITYSNGIAFTRESNIILYGLYSQTITLTTVANGTISNTNGTRYWAPAGSINPTFTVLNPSKSGAMFQGWSSEANSTDISNLSISNLSLTASTTRYAVFKMADSSVSGSPVGVVTTFNNYDETKTLYILDTSKYSGIEITAQVPVLTTSNNTTGVISNFAYVCGTLVRYTINGDPNTRNCKDQSGYIGKDGQTFTLSYNGNLTVRMVLNGFRNPGGTFYLESLKLIGKNVVG